MDRKEWTIQGDSQHWIQTYTGDKAIQTQHNTDKNKNGR